VIVQLDWCTGSVTKTLDDLNLSEDTIVIFTSDNGPVLDDGYYDAAVERLDGHTPSGPLRGGKYSAFEAGTRIPFIVRWPGTVKPGDSDALVCQIDFMSSFSNLTGQKLRREDAPDSFDILDALLGKSERGREHLVEQAENLSLIKGDWKYIEPHEGPKININTNIELGSDKSPQLYNLKTDVGEQNNVASKYPEIVKEMQETLQSIRQK
jgi:arylsulfatase A-like enzyme